MNGKIDFPESAFTHNFSNFVIFNQGLGRLLISHEVESDLSLELVEDPRFR